MAKFLWFSLLISLYLTTLTGCSGSDDDTYLAGPGFDGRIVSESSPNHIPGNNTDHTEFADENTQHEHQRSITLKNYHDEMNPADR